MTDSEFQSEAEHLLADAIAVLRALNSAVWLAHPAWAITLPETAQAAEVIADHETWSRSPEQYDGPVSDIEDSE